MNVNQTVTAMLSKLEEDCGYPNFETHINIIERNDVNFRIYTIKSDVNMLFGSFKSIINSIFMVIQSIIGFILDFFCLFIGIISSVFKHYKHVKVVNRLKSDPRFFEIIKKNESLKKDTTVVK